MAVPAPAPAPLTTAATRAQLVVTRVLGDVALQGERSHSAVRVGICVGACVLWPIAAMLGEDRTALVAVEAVALVALLVSTALWLLARRQMKTTQAFGLVSALVDVAFAGGLGVAVVLAPPNDFIGLLHVTGFAMIYISVCAAGIRLSKRTAVLAGVFAVVVIGAVHVLDRAVNPTISVDGPVHLMIGAILVAAASAIAMTMAARTQSVALSSAQQTLMFERARSALGAYVSSEIAEQAMQADVLKLGGARQRVSVIFTDLRGFTSSSETKEPEAIVRELNEYFEHMVRVIRQEGGVVDKYIGDSIMAVFGAPTPKPDDAARALRAAAGLVSALEALNVERASRGLAPLAHGVGFHTGDVVAGNIGTADRAQFTVIGDAVNVAARLESATKEHGVIMLASKDAVDAAKAVPGAELPTLRDVGAITVKGRSKAIEVLTV